MTVGTVEGEILVFTSGAIDGPPHARIGLPTGAHEPSAAGRLRDLTGDGQDDLVVGNRYRAPAGRGAVDVTTSGATVATGGGGGGGGGAGGGGGGAG
mgnify:CR=1 FL=1